MENIDFYSEYLIEELNKNGIKGCKVVDFEQKISDIQLFYENTYLSSDKEKRDKLRLSFWAFFSKLLIEKLGGKLQLAPKSDYCSNTPQLIDFGNRYDKKGRKKWIGIGFDSWLNGIVENKLLGTLQGTYEHIIKYYS